MVLSPTQLTLFLCSLIVIVATASQSKTPNKLPSIHALKANSFAPTNGIRHVEIYGGRQASTNEVPYIVTIGPSGDFAGEGECGGALIDPQFILTAAHCFQGNPPASSFRVSIGRPDLSNTASGVTATISAYYVHQEYNDKTLDNDIALMKLSSPATVNGQNIKVIPLYTGADVPFETPAIASGWGATASSDWSTKLLTVDLKIKNAPVCQLTSSDLAKKVCAVDTGKDTCTGDSGGPLAINDNGVTKLYGVVSYGASSVCGQAPLFGVYTKVSAYKDWIASAQNGQVSPPPPPSSANGFKIALSIVLSLVLIWIL